MLTASDKGSRGERVDESGALIAQMCEQAGMLVTRTVLLPDERDRLAAAMRELCDGGGCDLLLTTGGTGFAPGTAPRKRPAISPSGWSPVFPRPWLPTACSIPLVPC